MSAKFLYLRTRFVFGLKSGGSVAHTAGVINSLDSTTDLEILSNDDLPEVAPTYRIVRPKKLPLPISFRELLYNLRLILSEHPANSVTMYQRLSAFSFCGAWWSNTKRTFILEHNGSEVWGLKNWNKLYSWKTVNGFVRNLFKYGFEIPVAGWVERYNLRKAHRIVVVSDELERQLIDQGIPAEKIINYPNGVDPDKFSPEVDGSNIRKKYAFGDSIVFGFIGSFGQWHGTDILAEAIVEFVRKHPQSKARFLLIGDGLMMPTVRKTLGDLAENGRVILTGAVPQHEAPLYLAACDVLVSPHKTNPDGTRFFGSPTKLFEYMALAKPIIASKLEQIDDLLDHQHTAYMVDSSDVIALSEALHELDAHLEDYHEMGQNARQKVLDLYTWDKHVETILHRI